MRHILITGGARSGKSRYAQELAVKLGEPVLFVATATACDEEMHQRIARHRRERPAGWHTLEVTTGVGRRILEEVGGARVVLLDCVTLLVSNVLTDGHRQMETADLHRAEPAVMSEIRELTDCFSQTRANFIVVTNEVGLGLVPDSPLGRVYRDLLGKANQLLAQAADEVYFMVAGMPLRVKP
ncbi:MAG: bifunctional adenosylcobinamide kinase/adenosylcobinamide-phosphate guanylyltransferase [Chloroflexota bacterium]